MSNITVWFFFLRGLHSLYSISHPLAMKPLDMGELPPKKTLNEEKKNKINLRKRNTILDLDLDSLTVVSERTKLSKLHVILHNGSHPLL